MDPFFWCQHPCRISQARLLSTTAVVTKLLPRGLALHAPVPFYGLFSKSHGLESQVSRHKDFGGGDVTWGCVFNWAGMATVLGDKHAALVIIKFL
jgi:hypothetical protein